jgi:hypothetical protein
MTQRSYAILIQFRKHLETAFLAPKPWKRLIQTNISDIYETSFIHVFVLQRSDHCGADIYIDTRERPTDIKSKLNM